jgi:hypothetical protein
MRETFKEIAERQRKALAPKQEIVSTDEDYTTVEEPSIQPTPAADEFVNAEPVQSVAENPPASPEQVIPPPEAKVEEVEDWSSVTQGIKILIVLLGGWMFSKQVRPYLEQPAELSGFKSKKIEIPLHGAE